MDDTFMLDLFREEVRTHAQVLNEGLVALEGARADARQIEPLMRAAHSIKGAARIVAVEPAVKVAHVMEESLVKVQKGELTLTSAAIDILLRGVDTLTQIAVVAGPEFAAWHKEHDASLDELVQQLHLVSQGNLPADGTTGGKQDKPVDKPSSAEGTSAKPVAGPAPEIVPVVEPPSAPPPPKMLPAESEERVVRVTAQSLTRLMGLAGESLVEARWLQPFASSLLRLKRLQGRLADDLSELGQALPEQNASERGRTLLADATERLAECRQLIAQRIEEFETHARQSDDLNSRLYHEVIVSRMRPFRDGVQGFPRLIRDLARQLGKSIQFEVRGEMTNVDRDILDKLEAPLTHILRNAIDHGMETLAERQATAKAETGRIIVEARHSAGMLSISISDDGRGIDLEKLRRKVVERKLTTRDMAANLSEAELLEFLFLPGFSTAESVTEVSGRGVGLDVVHSMVHAVGGSVRIHTRPGAGTTFHLQLPITLSVIRAVLVQIAGEPYAFPHNRIDRLMRLPRSELHSLENRQYFEVDGRNLGIVLGRQIFHLDHEETPSEDLVVVLFSHQMQQYGLVVDGFRGEQDLVVRPLDQRLGKVPNISAAALLEDGSPVLIVDLDDLRRSIEKLLQSGRLQRAGKTAEQTRPARRKRVLVVDDSITVREVQRQLLINRGYEVETAVDGEDGWNVVREGCFDLVISDVDMPRLNGLEFVRRIKGEPRLQATPVVIVSYKDREEDRLRGLDAGANYYLTKSSFHDETLVQVVHDLIGDPGTMRVAIVNDLRLATEALRRVIGTDPRHEIAWTAGDGAEAVRLCQQDTPDVILMDLLMPVMNGAEATRRIMQTNPCAVLVVTATVAGNFALVYEALGHGAYDAVCTPALGDRPVAEAGAELLKKLASVDKINRHLKRLSGPPGACTGKAEKAAARATAMISGQLPVVAIGASTGGPAALAAVLSQWPRESPAAFVVVQHIGVEFAGPLAQWLGDRSKLKVRLAGPGDHLQADTVLVAGTNDHLVMAADRSLHYTPEPVDYPYRPSVDALFHSLAAHWSAPGVAALLTGIGRDGAEGLLKLRKAGWDTIAQDEASSVVYGMPRAARDLGAAAAIVPLDAIARHISDRIRQHSSSKP